jgi:hypothetical protein
MLCNEYKYNIIALVGQANKNSKASTSSLQCAAYCCTRILPVLDYVLAAHFFW